MILTPQIFSHDNTTILRGLAAWLIFIFHILLPFNITPLFNFIGGTCVAVFLLISGYGINESFHKKGLNNYWQVRWHRVILPFLLLCACCNLLSPIGTFKNFIYELLYIKPTFWFIFYVTSCYLTYWLSRRFGGPYWKVWLCLYSIFILNIRTPSGHLEAEQCFSFLLGVMASERKQWLSTISGRRVVKVAGLLFIVGAFFYIIKVIPLVHSYKNTIIYHYLLMPFRLSWAVVFMVIFTSRGKFFANSFLRWSGRYSLEIYIAHIPFIGYIQDIPSLGHFAIYSACAMVCLILYRLYFQSRLSLTHYAFIIVNTFFVAKYSARLFPQAFSLLTFAAIFLQALLLAYVMPWLDKHHIKPYHIIIGAMLFFLLMVGLQYSIDPYSIKVDRWSALHFPIQYLLHGQYPYAAPTHLNGYASPFPVWLVIHIPFYLLGNVGLSLFVSMGAFLWSIWKRQGWKAVLIALVCMACSPSIWYEVSVRSDLITNILFLATGINIVFGKLSLLWVHRNALYIAMSVALAASTRLIVLIPCGLLLIPFFIKLDFRRQLLTLTIFAMVFLCTFVIIALWNWDMFFHFEYNPWSLQTRQGHTTDLIIFVLLEFVLAFTWIRDTLNISSYTPTMSYTLLEPAYCRNVVIMLFTIVMTTFVHNMADNNNWDIFSSTYDITYLNCILPFCILYIAQRMHNTASIQNNCYVMHN